MEVLVSSCWVGWTGIPHHSTAKPVVLKSCCSECRYSYNSLNLLLIWPQSRSITIFLNVAKPKIQTQLQHYSIVIHLFKVHSKLCTAYHPLSWSVQPLTGKFRKKKTINCNVCFLSVYPRNSETCLCHVCIFPFYIRHVTVEAVRIRSLMLCEQTQPGKLIHKSYLTPCTVTATKREVINIQNQQQEKISSSSRREKWQHNTYRDFVICITVVLSTGSYIGKINQICTL